MHNFKEFQVWKRGVSFCKNAYELAAPFPEEEKFGIISQTRRCVVSIPSNNAEGAGRKMSKYFSRYLSIFLGSQFERKAPLLIFLGLGLVNESSLMSITRELNEKQKMT
jgi:four helix bundle protein